ncbi:hypothetical protein HII31_13074 [Pseudocercospora fuligena]|uniref:Uncharacterized protein n=1 Tax=Pseudocercospora fuligena TaxID=685502 RepID=A0A8H6VCH1_9PEZI|nr:hypothetical protein HII31_13074 [Pseudocercospora fuligena]
MSSNIDIPQRNKARGQGQASAESSPSSSSPSSFPSLSAKQKSKLPIGALPSSSPPLSPSPRRPSLLGSSLSKSEYTVINLGGHSEHQSLRLVSCVKSSQGFDWNQELFLPSYANDGYDGQDLEHRPDPVFDIVLTDEEAESILPS